MKEFLKNRNLPAWVLSAAGALVLAVLFIVWLLDGTDRGAAEIAAAALCVLLFAVVGVRFVFRWTEDWQARRTGAFSESLREPFRAASRAGEDAEISSPFPARSVLVKIFFAVLAGEIAALVLFWLIRLLEDGWMGFPEAMSLWTHLDVQHYLNIARDGYISGGDASRVVELVFLPGYPLAVRLFALIAGSEFLAGFIVSLLSIAGAGVTLYCLARLDMDHAGALRALKYALLLPGAVFFCGPMSESFFLLLSLSCVYLLRRKRWLAACVLGGLAAFTRTLGLVLLVPAAYELISDTLTARPGGWDRRAVERRVWSFAALLVIPLGFAAYCVICWRVSGDPFKFLEYQREHWDQRLGLFFNTASYQTEHLLTRIGEGSVPGVMGLWGPNVLCVFGALALLIPGAKRLRPSYTAFFLIYFIIAVGPTWLLSAPRYLAAAFPLSLTLAFLTEDRRADSMCTAGLAVLFVLYDYVLVARWQVW